MSRLGGYDAVVNPAALSAGERQLIALTRSYLSPAPIAILDEATCHLDPAAEAQAEAAFASRHGTLIVVAHRITSALRAQRVLVLDGNRPQAGDHASLLASSAMYRDLVGYWSVSSGSAGGGSSGRVSPLVTNQRRPFSTRSSHGRYAACIRGPSPVRAGQREVTLGRPSARFNPRVAGPALPRRCGHRSAGEAAGRAATRTADPDRAADHRTAPGSAAAVPDRLRVHADPLRHLRGVLAGCSQASSVSAIRSRWPGRSRASGARRRLRSVPARSSSARISRSTGAARSGPARRPPGCPAAGQGQRVPGPAQRQGAASGTEGPIAAGWPRSARSIAACRPGPSGSGTSRHGSGRVQSVSTSGGSTGACRCRHSPRAGHSDLGGQHPAGRASQAGQEFGTAARAWTRLCRAAAAASPPPSALAPRHSLARTRRPAHPGRRRSPRRHRSAPAGPGRRRPRTASARRPARRGAAHSAARPGCAPHGPRPDRWHGTPP